MIFVSVGSRYPFDRLVKAVDKWAGENRGEEVFVQGGDGDYLPEYCKFAPYLTSHEFKEAVSRCEMMISHAGMGNIITALEYSKPIVLVPRLPEFGEVVNDHQVGTVKSLGDKSGVFVLEDLNDFSSLFEFFRSRVVELEKLGGASGELINRIRLFINS